MIEDDIFATALATAERGRRNSGSTMQPSTLVDGQLEAYYARFSSKNAPIIKDEFQFWDNCGDYPLLNELAIIVLAIPATSAPVERIFSIAGNILAEERLRMTDANLENQVMIRVNKKLFKSLFFD